MMSESSKRHSKFLSLIFILKCLSKASVIRIFKSPVFLELGRLMSHDDLTALLLVSGDEANSVNCLRRV